MEQDEKWNLYKEIVFMIAPLKKSIPIVIQALSETKITGECLKSEIKKCIFDLMEVVFKVRAAITGYHPSNVNVFIKLCNMLDGILFILMQQKHLRFLI